MVVPDLAAIQVSQLGGRRDQYLAQTISSTSSIRRASWCRPHYQLDLS